MSEIKSPRVIAGAAKNKKLISPPDLFTRPLLGRIKKSLFDILVPKIDNAIFLDLYAGIGNVGIEALSRGAKEVVFVEKSPQCIAIIENNLQRCGFSENAQVLFADIIEKIPEFNKKFNLIFIGPPYKANILALTIKIIDKKSLLSKDGWIIGQHHFKELVPKTIAGFTMFRQEKYGNSRLSFFK